ncbi:MAG: toll/interleukin-1 receptor domain-containing protein [Chloroflexi bacterium]|nr:toll/interleukin-1 receptor domain-containing protein [Chloroflexota bacterium]
MGYVAGMLANDAVRRCIPGKEENVPKGYCICSCDSDPMDMSTLVFTNRMFVYVENWLDHESRVAVISMAREAGFHAVVRDKEYARRRTEIAKPFAFISHDSRDKDELVRGLALELQKIMCPVWYDEFSLSVGDSLRESIETGLKKAKYCILVLSASFFSNKGWGKAEFDSVFTREILEERNVILPVWHNVTVREVYEYSPRLADKVGLPSTLGTQQLARRLRAKIDGANGFDPATNDVGIPATIRVL